MSIPNHIITRPFQMAGEFSIRKAGSGRDRIRELVFRTADGFEGVSRKWDRREAYDAALKVRAKALANKQVAAAAPAPEVAKPAPEARLLHAMHESDLCAELERRGYAVCPAELIGLDANGNQLVTA